MSVTSRTRNDAASLVQHGIRDRGLFFGRRMEGASEGARIQRVHRVIAIAAASLAAQTVVQRGGDRLGLG